MFGFPSWAALAIVAAMSAGSAAWLTNEVNQGTIAEMKLAYQAAQIEAEKLNGYIRRSQDRVAEVASQRFGTLQIQTITHTLTVQKEVTKYVTETRGCITFGFVRVLDAEILGVSPDQLPLPTGQSDDACSGITNASMAGQIIANYGRAKLDAGQLEGLRYFSAEQVALAPRPSD